MSPRQATRKRRNFIRRLLHPANPVGLMWSVHADMMTPAERKRLHPVGGCISANRRAAARSQELLNLKELGVC